MRRTGRLGRCLVFGLCALVLAGCSGGPVYRDTSVEMRTVEVLDTPQYLGLWYEIARFPNRFEEGCVGVTAQYGLREDGKVSVLNTCFQGTLDGPKEQAEGVATVQSAGKLRVTFVPWLSWIASGDYWVMGLKDYQISVVGAPNGKTGWILARKPRLSEAEKDWAQLVLSENGYDLDQLTWTKQRAAQ